MRRTYVALFACTAVAGACSTPRATPAHDEAQPVAVARLGLARAAPSMDAMAERRAQEPQAPVDGEVARITRPDLALGMVIRSGQANIEVDSLERAVAAVRALADRVGGYVANTTMQTGRHQLRSASLEVKMPAERFEEALAGLSPIGRLESVDVSAQDVGEEFVDVTARMDNARRLEGRLIDLIATRTGKLRDVLDVERELARVREEIERYSGRLRYLRAHAALSTLTVNVHEPVPVVGHAGTSVLGEAFKQAWRNFVGLIALLVRSLGVVLPLGAVALGGWALVRRRLTRAARATAA
jgi:hypothetical protein